MTTRADIIAYARTLIGTPFDHQGRLPGVAIDCGGVLVAIASHFSLPHNDFINYQRQPAPALFREVLLENLDQVQGPGVAGDILSFSFVVQQHLAIVTALEPLTILHAYEPYGKVTEHAVNDWWRRRMREWWSFRGLE